MSITLTFHPPIQPKLLPLLLLTSPPQPCLPLLLFLTSPQPCQACQFASAATRMTRPVSLRGSQQRPRMKREARVPSFSSSALDLVFHKAGSSAHHLAKLSQAWTKT